MKLGLAMLRTIVGGLFVGHGLQKLAGWFGGYGLDATGKAFESMGLRPGKANAAAAGGAEAVGGALLIGGLATPAAASLISATMITAIRKVHGTKGPWVTNGGYEYNLVLLGVVFALAELGPGDWSLDEALGNKRAGVGVALGQLAAAAVGSAVVVMLGSRDGDQGSAESAVASDEGAAGTDAQTNGDGPAVATT